MEGVEIREISIYEDERGWLGEIIRDDESDHRPVMSYLSLTKPGLTRGPHEHLEQTDYFCFMGRFRLYLWDNRKSSSTYGEEKVVDTSSVPTIAVVPPGVVHAYRNMDSRDALVFNLPDRLYCGEGKKEGVDEVRHEYSPDSPFRIKD